MIIETKVRWILISAIISTICSLLHGEEFLVFQGERTFSESDNGFHYYYREANDIPLSWPDDWMEPIDYWGGKLRIRIDLKSTPKDLPLTLQACIWMHDEDGQSGYGDELESCSSQKVNLSKPGVYEAETSIFKYWWHKNSGANAIDISRPHHFKRIGLVMRTADNCYVSPYNITPNCWDQRDQYLPLQFHITIVAISAGSGFSGWKNYLPKEDEFLDSGWLGWFYIKNRPWVWSYALNQWVYLPLTEDFEESGVWFYFSSS